MERSKRGSKGKGKSADRVMVSVCFSVFISRMERQGEEGEAG